MTAPTDSTPAGTAVEAVFTKYDGSPHWREPYRLLGVDEFGVWLGMGVGTTYSRPGRTITSRAPSVRLIPHVGRWAAIFNAAGPGVKVHIYVDITDTPRWSVPDASTPDISTPASFTVAMVDLDLDVVQRFSGGRAFIDDMDEFEQHQLEFGYPEDLIEQVRTDAFVVLNAVRERQEPFGDVGQQWLSHVA